MIPWTAAYQAPPSMEFSRQEYWSGVPSPSPNTLSVHPICYEWWNRIFNGRVVFHCVNVCVCVCVCTRACMCMCIYISHILLNHYLLMDMGCFHSLAIVHSADTYIKVYLSFQIRVYIFSRCVPMNRIAGSYDSFSKEPPYCFPWWLYQFISL